MYFALVSKQPSQKDKVVRLGDSYERSVDENSAELSESFDFLENSSDGYYLVPVSVWIIVLSDYHINAV